MKMDILFAREWLWTRTGSVLNRGKRKSEMGYNSALLLGVMENLFCVLGLKNEEYLI